MMVNYIINEGADMKKIVILSVVGLAFILGMTLQSKAEVLNFSGVIPFTTASGRFGFFSQNHGRIYVYDNDLKKCIFKGQLSALGEDITTIDEAISVDANTK
jgi:hypothetical protein